MEFFGFLLLILGAAGMDSRGGWWYVAAGMMLLGILFMYVGGRFADDVKRSYRCGKYLKEGK